MATVAVEPTETGLTYDPAKGLTGKELRDYLGYGSSSFPSDAVKTAIANGENCFVATKAIRQTDRVWRWEGEGKNRRYFRNET